MTNPELKVHLCNEYKSTKKEKNEWIEEKKTKILALTREREGVH